MTRAATCFFATVLAVASLGGGGISALEGQTIDAAVHSGIAAARPLLQALERFRSEQGRYPQMLDELVPHLMPALPGASSEDGAGRPFVYHGQGDAFEMFWLPDARGEQQILYRSTAAYPERLEPGPYRLLRRLEGWAWYVLIPMRPVPILREWRGRVSLDRAVGGVSVVTDRGRLERLWAELGIAERVPDIDFGEHLLLVAIERSSLVLFMGPVVDDRGDLKPNSVATPDQPGFRSYALGLVSRAGIRSVGGAPL